MRLAFWKKRPPADSSAYRMAGWKRKIITLIVISIFSSILFFSAGHILMRQDDLETSATKKDTVLLLLMGGLVPRSNHAIEIIQGGIADKIIFFKPQNQPIHDLKLIPNEGDLTKQYLISKEIDPSKIEYIESTKVSSTYDEAKQFKKWLSNQNRKPKTVIVVTEWFHTGRAGNVIEKVLGKQPINVLVSPAFSLGEHPSKWWRHESSFLNVFNEYLKKLYYLYLTLE